MYWPLGAAKIFATDGLTPRTVAHEDENGDVKKPEKTPQDLEDAEPAPILGLQVSRNGNLFSTITHDTLNLWQTSPTVILSAVSRSAKSLQTYGANTSVTFRPDSSIVVVQTTLGFLITYTVTTDASVRVYQQQRENGPQRRHGSTHQLYLDEERQGLPEVTLRFRMVIKIDAGIATFLPFDEDLVVATGNPPAIQCVRWAPDDAGNQTTTELLAKMPWMGPRCRITSMIHDRAMNLTIWTTSDGGAYAVQRTKPGKLEAGDDVEAEQRLFRGNKFHDPETKDKIALTSSINARFSLLAIACADAEVMVYSARDYVGNVPLSHSLRAPASHLTTGDITTMTYSPDGYCLFVGFQRGWAMWSVYGKLLSHSFVADGTISRANDENWLLKVDNATWFNSGSSMMMSQVDDHRLWVIEMAKLAVTGCYCASNIARTTLLADSNAMIYTGYDLPLSTTPSASSSLWHHVQLPTGYLLRQRPIRSAVISSNGRYLAVAGRRGLAHYSLASGRWRTFEDLDTENSFVVRGGMCWFQHVLIVAVETGGHHELRLYSRDRGLDRASLLYEEQLPASVVTMSLTGQDSLLVYTYLNILYHFVINAAESSVSLVQVGQIALNGIIRAPARVRSVSWILPEYQQREGDPSRDVSCASVLFLVDAKLVLLQPSYGEDGSVKYDMKVVAQNVEFFDLSQDQTPLYTYPSRSTPGTPRTEGMLTFSREDRGLSDSLWYFDGTNMNCWLDVEDLIEAVSSDNQRELPQAVEVPVEFYPTSVVQDRALFLGLDADLIQRRDAPFAFFKYTMRSQLFLPSILCRHLINFDPAAATALASRYQDLPYFSHALEILLHRVLDDEVDNPPESPEMSLLPAVTSFLSSFPDYLDIVVQCTRKTELRSWRTLFAHLPPPHELFNMSMDRGLLKTAGGYLLVLQNLEEREPTSEHCIRLMRKARDAGYWDLCKELARFLMALDTSGSTLRDAMTKIHLPTPEDGGNTQHGVGLGIKNGVLVDSA